MFDANCHLQFEPLWADWQGHWQRAQQAGLTGALVTAVDVRAQSLSRLAALADFGFEIGLGWHPLLPAPAEALDLLVRHLQEFPRACVGEIGLDYRQGVDPHLFADQLDIAQDLDRAVVIHAVGPGALDAAYVQVKSRSLRGWVHAFSGSPEQASRWLDCGMALSIGGPLLNAQSNRLRRWVQAVPLDGLVVESDAPDLAPAGERLSTPEVVSRVVREVARLKTLDVDEVAKATRVNALRGLGLASVPRVGV